MTRRQQSYRSARGKINLFEPSVVFSDLITGNTCPLLENMRVRMALDTTPIDTVSEATLHELLENGVSEGQSLDYKRDKVGNSDADKKEFLRDVSSFANARGGHLILGVNEDKGNPTEIVGVDVDDADKEILRLENIIRDGIRPSLIGLKIKGVRLCNGKMAFVVRIPKGLNPPYQTIFQNDYSIYGRNSAGKHRLTSDEIRHGVVGALELLDRIRLWRTGRVSKFIAKDLPRDIPALPYLLIHTVPLNSFFRRKYWQSAI